MRNAVLGLGVLVGIALAPFTACAQPSVSEMTEWFGKMVAFSQDFNDLAKVTQGADWEAAVELSNIAGDYSGKILHIRDLLFTLTLIKNDSDRVLVKSMIVSRIEGILLAWIPTVTS